MKCRNLRELVVQAHCSSTCAWDVPCTSPCYHLLGCAGLVLLASPSAFLTRRMVDQIRGIDLDVVPEDRYNIKVNSSYLINHSPCQKCRGGCKEHKACTSKQVVTWTCTWNIPSASRAAVSLYNKLAEVPVFHLICTSLRV